MELLLKYEALWDRRRDDTSVYEEIERLCRLDLTLIEAAPQVIHAGTGYVNVPAFNHLIWLYEREGMLAEAPAVAERAEHYGQRIHRAGPLRARLDRLAR